MGLLAGKVLVVSGVGPGLGAQVALAAANEGAAVVMGARNASLIETLAADITSGGGRAAWATCDVTQEEQCAALVAIACERFGGVDCVVNNAYMSGPLDIPIEHADFDVWRQVFDVNLYGSLQMVRATLPALRRRGGGSIIFVGSQIVRRVFAGRGPYAASKAALLTAAQVLAREVGADNIRVNSVLPGRMWGPPLEAYYRRQAEADGVSTDEAIAAASDMIALGRIPTDEECAGAVLFLASDLAVAMTGQTVDVNGGETFH
jgi:NAD(P)-dependent dehydrogenase (short-subunit alcohol dehydrogenase family)